MVPSTLQDRNFDRDFAPLLAIIIDIVNTYRYPFLLRAHSTHYEKEDWHRKDIPCEKNLTFSKYAKVSKTRGSMYINSQSSFQFSIIFHYSIWPPSLSASLLQVVESWTHTRGLKIIKLYGKHGRSIQDPGAGSSYIRIIHKVISRYRTSTRLAPAKRYTETRDILEDTIFAQRDIRPAFLLRPKGLCTRGNKVSRDV